MTFVIDSPIAMRPEAGAETTAILVRSPIAMVSPLNDVCEVTVTAESAIGVCVGSGVGIAGTAVAAGGSGVGGTGVGVGSRVVVGGTGVAA